MKSYELRESIEKIVYSQFPEISIDEKYVLRQPTIEIGDINSIKAIYTDPDVIKFVPDDCIPKSEYAFKIETDHYRGLYISMKSIYWFIARKSDNVAIGTIGLPTWDRYNSKCEMSYNLHSSYHNLGIMTRAIASVVNYCFNILQVVRIECQLDPTNLASQIVLNKNGFQADGILPKYRFYKNNSHVDVLIMSITDEKWRSIID